MTRDDIIRMAREAQLGTSLIHKGGEQRVWIEGADWHDELKRFAALVAALEREAIIAAAIEQGFVGQAYADDFSRAMRARSST